MNKPMCLGLPILELSKILRYEFQYDYVKLKRNMIFIKILQTMLKLDLILQMMNQKNNCLKEKSNYINERGIKLKNHDKRAKPYSYLIDDGSEDTKPKSRKKLYHQKKT